MIFQPAEEGPGGAKPMIDEGVLEGIDEVYGWHNFNSGAKGTVQYFEKECMAQSCMFTAKVIGKGGHGAYPHLNVDPLL
jgi:amidohydrolase